MTYPATRKINFGEFASVFQENIYKRSRTAKGVFKKGLSGSSVEKVKKYLKKSGLELEKQVAKNTGTLTNRVWNDGHRRGIDASFLRKAMEDWYDIIQHELQDIDPYKEERERLEESCKAIGVSSDVCFTNRRYRVWDVNYAEQNPKPIHLEKWMYDFYEELVRRIWHANGNDIKSLGELLAWVDRSMDLIIHPWADGCGRMSTALVMWISLFVSALQLPRFGDREEHYDAMKDGRTHARYFQRCLES